jgi:TPP-dependent pyruvate/acetoin dehydrogenase alpha subunit
MRKANHNNQIHATTKKNMETGEISKQSSIEFLEFQIIKNGIITNSDLKQAKAMHKQEIEDAYKADLDMCSEQDAEDYYTQTFEQ